MRDDGGYTLTEALVALAIVALALAGVTQAARLATRQTASAARGHDAARDLAAVQALLSRAPAGLGPFYSDEPTFRGDKLGARFACARSRPCGLRLVNSSDQVQVIRDWGERPRKITITRRVEGHLSFITQDGAVETAWPVGGSDARLAAIALSDGDRLLAVLRLPVENRPGCVGRPRLGSCAQTSAGAF
jgi:prepilin-type N-terminal cleavage/methylation domain-containing protein